MTLDDLNKLIYERLEAYSKSENFTQDAMEVLESFVDSISAKIELARIQEKPDDSGRNFSREVFQSAALQVTQTFHEAAAVQAHTITNVTATIARLLNDCKDMGEFERAVQTIQSFQREDGPEYRVVLGGSDFEQLVGGGEVHWQNAKGKTVLRVVLADIGHVTMEDMVADAAVSQGQSDHGAAFGSAKVNQL